jgi:hypothetical protein
MFQTSKNAVNHATMDTISQKTSLIFDCTSAVIELTLTGSCNGLWSTEDKFAHALAGKAYVQHVAWKATVSRPDPF